MTLPTVLLRQDLYRIKVFYPDKLIAGNILKFTFFSAKFVMQLFSKFTENLMVFCCCCLPGLQFVWLSQVLF